MRNIRLIHWALCMDRERVVSIVVAREDDLKMTARIVCKYNDFSAQSYWKILMNQIQTALQLNAIHLLLEHSTMFPVYTIARLKNEGCYLVRVSESAAIVEALAAQSISSSPSRPYLRCIQRVQADLQFDESEYNRMEPAVATLIKNPQFSNTESTLVQRILTAKELSTLMAILPLLFFQESSSNDEVTLHRVMLESIERLWGTLGTTQPVKEETKEAKDSEEEPSSVSASIFFVYLHQVLQVFPSAVDVVLFGLKLLTVLFPSLPKSLYGDVLDCIMDSLQTLAPPAPIRRPRIYMLRPRGSAALSFPSLAANQQHIDSPAVEKKIFSGYSQKQAANLAIQQAFITLYSILRWSEALRKQMVDLHVEEELAELALLLLDQPVSLQYCAWILNLTLGTRAVIQDRELVLSESFVELEVNYA